MWYLFQCLNNNRKIDKAFEISWVISWYRRWDNHCSPYISNIFFTSYLNFITSCLIVWIIMALSHLTLMASCLDPYIHYYVRESISSLFFMLGECPDTVHHYSLWEKCCYVLTPKSKSIFISLHFKKESLARVSQYKDLGVVLCPSLRPAEHIASVSRRASSLLGFVCRSSKDLTSPASLLTLYKTLVRPIME